MHAAPTMWDKRSTLSVIILSCSLLKALERHSSALDPFRKVDGVKLSTVVLSRSACLRLASAANAADPADTAQRKWDSGSFIEPSCNFLRFSQLSGLRWFEASDEIGFEHVFNLE